MQIWTTHREELTLVSNQTTLGQKPYYLQTASTEPYLACTGHHFNVFTVLILVGTVCVCEIKADYQVCHVKEYSKDKLFQMSP